MKVGSLFSGYGGLDMAVGGDLAWYAEVEPAACKVMEAHHPGVPNLGDVTKVDWAEVEEVDVITGGYPCQPFSNAGKRKGKNDERHLWPHVRDAISALRPQRAVLENVRGHLTLGFDDVLADLATLGLSARWGVVRAADAGAPHNRARLFIVTYAAGNISNERPFGNDAQHETSARLLQVSVRGNGGNAANATSNEWAAAQPDDLHARGTTELGERTSAVANPSGERHGSGQRSAGLDGVGCAPEGSRRKASAARQEPGAGSVESVSDPNSGPGDGRRAKVAHIRPKLNQQEDTQPSRVSGLPETNWGDYAPAIHRWETVIGRSAPAPTIQRAQRDRLNPAFVEWMMGLPEGWVTGHGLSASQELKMLGNGVVPQQAALALRLLGAA